VVQRPAVAALLLGRHAHLPRDQQPPPGCGHVHLVGKFFPFYVTASEVRCSEDVGERFHLFRVFDFARTPRVYNLSGSMGKNCRLEATAYRATIWRESIRESGENGRVC
jgi:hypothetical protein